jgi:hypothetical protein
MDGGRAIVLAACPVFDVGVMASRRRLMAADENEFLVSRHITVQGDGK